MPRWTPQANPRPRFLRHKPNMRIAQVAPLHESVPPRLYGGTERVVSYLTEELVRMGHEVTLFASGDSQTRARLVPCAPHSLRLDETCVDPNAHHALMVEKVFQSAEQFDLIHFHIDYLHYSLWRNSGLPYLTTLHGRLDLPDLVPLYREFDETPLVSISDNQRRPLPWANWLGTVHHGIPMEQFPFFEKPGKYLAFLGRISPEKRVDRAIEIAISSGVPLKIAAKIGKPDQEYHEAVIRPLLGHPLVEFIGEISDAQKAEFLGNARALLFPIDWPEPFGLAMIEAMAVGTPVIAYPCGSVPELVDDGVTGYVVRSIEEAAQAVDACSHFDRSACRERASVRFSARRMARDYEAIYNRILSARLMELNRTLTALAEREPTPSMSVNIPVQGESWPSLPSESATSTTFGRDPL